MSIIITLQIIDAILISFFGTFITQWYATVKKWDGTFMPALFVSAVWYLPIFLIEFLFYDLVYVNFLIAILITCVNTIIGIPIVMIIYRKKLTHSMFFVIIIQIILFIIILIINLTLKVVNVFMKYIPIEVINNVFNESKFTFILSFFGLLGISVLVAYWGDKIQLIKHRNLVAIIGITSGISYLMFTFVSQQIVFIVYAFLNFIISLTISIIITIIVKQIAYSAIPYQTLKELFVLEKGKELLKVKDLHVYYPLLKGTLKRQVGSVKAVTGVSFGVKTGETLGLVGESGCGKTTIANAILGLVDKTSGEILFHNTPIPPEYTSWLRQKIQIVFQDPDASLNPRMKVVDVIAEPLKNLLGITNKMQIRRHVLKLLNQVSLKREHMDRYPHEFSGGQKQRIIIARALASNPELIILDEPTSALDVSVQAQILNLLKDLQVKYGYGFLFITHNLAVVSHIADRIAVMYLGKFVEVGSKEQIFSNPTHPYTQDLLASRSEIDPYNQEINFTIKGEVPSPIAPPPGCTYNPRCSSDARTKDCELNIPHKIKIEEGHFIWCNNPPTSMQTHIQESEERLSLE
ncbi:MAG: ABC transporter ATP-binding protein [Promethearchaeota archaeon]